jgi:membrane protein
MIDQARNLTEEAQRRFPVRVALKFLADRGTNHAVLIAWNGLTSLFPIILAILAIAGGVLSLFGVTRRHVVDLLLNLLPATGNGWNAAIDAIQGVQERPGLFGVLAVVTFFWSASGLFGALDETLAVVFRSRPRPFLSQKLMALGMMFLFCILTVAAVGTATIVAVLRSMQFPLVPQEFTRGFLGPLIQIVVATISGFLLFYSIYAIVPSRKLRPLQILPGAIVGGVGFVLLTLLFPLYVTLNSGINQYGREFAFLLLLLAFFYFLGLITVLGAEVNSVLFPQSMQQGEHEDEPTRRPARSWRARLPAPILSLIGSVLGVGLALRRRRRRAVQ